jgi:hypothetical protein
MVEWIKLSSIIPTPIPACHLRFNIEKFPLSMVQSLKVFCNACNKLSKEILGISGNLIYIHCKLLATSDLGFVMLDIQH